MVRGTTAQFKFKLPYTKNNIELVEVKFWQSGNLKGLNEDYPLPITKIYRQEISEDGSLITNSPWNWIDDYTLLIRLGQRETLTFSDKLKARVQLRLRTVDGLVAASDPQIISVGPAPWDEPLGNDIINQTDDDWVILDGDTISEAGDA